MKRASRYALPITPPIQGRFRVLRGGSWYSHGWDCRSAGRGRVDPGVRDGYLGFRIIRAPKREGKE